MTAKSDAKLRLPQGLSPEEEAQWWDEHPDYWDTVGTKWEVVDPTPVVRTGDTHLRLPLWMIEALRHRAEGTGFSYQWLIRVWIEERLRQEGITRPAPQPDGAGGGTTASPATD